MKDLNLTVGEGKEENVAPINDDLENLIKEGSSSFANANSETLQILDINDIKEFQVSEEELREDAPLYTRNYRAHTEYLGKLYKHYLAKNYDPDVVQSILDNLFNDTNLAPQYSLPLIFNGLDWKWITELALEFKCPPQEVFSAGCALSRLIEKRHQFIPQLIQKMTWQAAAINRLSNNILTKINEWAVAHPSLDNAVALTNSAKQSRIKWELPEYEGEPFHYGELVKLSKESKTEECILPKGNARWLISKIKAMDNSKEQAFIKDICYNLKIVYINSPDTGAEKCLDEVVNRFGNFMEVISQYERISESIEVRLLELETSVNITLNRIRKILK